MAKNAQRNIPIAPCDGTDMSHSIQPPRVNLPPRFSPIPRWNVERLQRLSSNNARNRRHLTMYLKICAVLVLMQIVTTAAFAVARKAASSGSREVSCRYTGGTSRLRAGLDQVLPRLYSGYRFACWRAYKNTAKSAKVCLKSWKITVNIAAPPSAPSDDHRQAALRSQRHFLDRPRRAIRKPFRA